jgi:hypothetical protein
VRQHPPEMRCWTLTGRTPRSAALLVNPDGQVGGEPQDHVLVVAEPAGQPQAVWPRRRWLSAMPLATAPRYQSRLTAALPGSSPPPWPSPRFREARHSLCPPTGRLSNGRRRLRVMLRTASSLSYTVPLTLGSDLARFQAEPPACYRASWQLPGPDFHRQATTSLRT